MKAINEQVQQFYEDKFHKLFIKSVIIPHIPMGVQKDLYVVRKVFMNMGVA